MKLFNDSKIVWKLLNTCIKNMIILQLRITDGKIDPNVFVNLLNQTDELEVGDPK